VTTRFHTPAWTGALWLGDGWAAHRGAVGDSRAHAHHAHQITASPAPLLVEIGDHVKRGTGFVIPSLQPHRLRPAAQALNIYVDATSRVGRRLTAWLGERPQRLSSTATAALLALDPAAISEGALLTCMEAMAEHEQETTLDPRLATVLDRLELAPGEPTPLRQLAEDVGLSEGRLSRLFARQLGLAYRPYRKWRRLQHAFLLLGAGDNLTGAAVEAGFSDAAHLARTVRRLFGVTPSTVATLLDAGQVRSRRGGRA
jgi:AraC-like DNA-binding protein